VALERRQLSRSDEPLRLVVEARLRRRGRQPLDERPREPRERRHPVREQVCRIRVVAAEELVAALPGERDLDVLRGKLRDEVRRQRGRVGERLVERLGERGQEQRRVRADEQLVMVRPVALGDEPSVGALVEAPLLEADRERVHGLRRLLRCERGEHGGVDSARKKHADGHVGQQVGAHRVAQAGAQLLDELRFVVAAELLDGHGAGAGIAAELDAVAFGPHEQVACGQLPRVAEDRVRRGDRVEREKGLERVEIDLAARERAQLRCKLERIAAVAVVERLDPVAVAAPGQAVVPLRPRARPRTSRGAAARTRDRDARTDGDGTSVSQCVRKR